jgi:hypothetical protein
LRFKTFLLLNALFLIGSVGIFAQSGTTAQADVKTDAKEIKAESTLPPKESKGIGVAESSIFVYSGGRGRDGLGQIRKTTVEIGKMELIDSEGKSSVATYERRVLRGDSLKDEKIRLDQKFPNAEYALVYNADNIFGVFNNSVFTPREDAANSFKDRIWHGLEALLRYKENGSKVELEKEEKEMGVEYYIVNVTDKQDRKTTFYVSKKFLKIMKIEYVSNGVKYRRKFYDYKYAQGVLVPYRTVLWADGKQIEEEEIATVTYGQVVGEELFKNNTQ